MTTAITASQAARLGSPPNPPFNNWMARLDAQVQAIIATGTGVSNGSVDGQLLIWDNSLAQWVPKAVSSDATLAKTGALTLKNTGTAGTYGDATHTLTVTTDAQGRVTAVTTNAISAAGDTYHDDGNVSGAVTVAYGTSTVHKLTLTGNITSMSVTGTTNGVPANLTLYMTQDGTGSRTSAWPSGTKWPGGIVPILSTTASAIDIVVMQSNDGGTTWFANLAGRAYA